MFPFTDGRNGEKNACSFSHNPCLGFFRGLPKDETVGSCPSWIQPPKLVASPKVHAPRALRLFTVASWQLDAPDDGGLFICDKGIIMLNGENGLRDSAKFVFAAISCPMLKAGIIEAAEDIIGPNLNWPAGCHHCSLLRNVACRRIDQGHCPQPMTSWSWPQ